MILRELYEADAKIAVIGYGRMNPPTIGHGVLVDAINAKAKKYGGNPMLFLSMTHLAKGSEKSYLTPTGKTNKHFQTAGIKNPLDWKTKLGYAQKFFDIPISTDPSLNTIMSVMKHLENEGYEKVVLVCGSDRVREFETQILPYNNTADQSGNVNFNIKEVSVEEGGFRDEEANDASGMSASKMRDAAAQDDFEAFKQGVPDQSVAQQMFDDVRRGLGFEHQQESTVNEYVGPIIGALKYGKYAFKIAKWIYKNKWSIAFFTATWKTIGWIGDAVAWAKRFLDHPITQALGRYGLPAVALAVALYGGRKLYMQLIDMEREGLDEKEMQKQLAEFNPDASELQAFEKEMEDLIADKKESYGSVIDDLDLSEESKEALKLIKQHNEEPLDEFNIFKGKVDNSSVKEQDPNKLKVLDWIGDRSDGKAHFLSFYKPGAAFSGNVIWIRPDAAKKFMRKWDNNEEHQDRMKKALTSVQTTSTLFTNLEIKHEVKRAR